MTYEEAHDYLENMQREMTRHRNAYSDRLIEANGIAILAIEKQIKKKPLNVTYDDGYLECWNCPNCHIQHSEEIKVFCDVCGQAIDWRSVRHDG